MVDGSCPTISHQPSTINYYLFQETPLMRPSPFEVFGRVSLAFLSLFIGLPYDVWAGPQGAQVVHGQVQFQNLGATPISPPAIERSSISRALI